jgi:hypothetical protein
MNHGIRGCINMISIVTLELYDLLPKIIGLFIFYLDIPYPSAGPISSVFLSKSFHHWILERVLCAHPHCLSPTPKPCWACFNSTTQKKLGQISSDPQITIFSFLSWFSSAACSIQRDSKIFWNSFLPHFTANGLAWWSFSISLNRQIKVGG